MLADKDYDNAILNYEKALGIKTQEAYPKEQIEKAKQEKQLAQEKAELDRQYDNIIKTADHQYKNLNYDNAKTL